ncbi:MAG: fatty acid desaturase [Mycobacteriaceae bacterium]|nr:fatty acid desaturase [Mycobacteriaceae bacterium]
MAITDVLEYAHLTPADVEALGAEFDAIRREVETSRGERDARYIRRVVRFQRALEIGGRLVLFGSRRRPAWWTGVALLGTAKIVENMEIGHNVMHGQWDWMNDPEIHSSTWEWDNTGPSKHWKHTHNYLHHKYTNVLGMDDDIGYGLLRVTRDQRWRPFNLGNPVYNLLLQLSFEYGVAIQHLELGKVAKGRADRAEFERKRGEVLAKVGQQVAKDYVLFPLLTGRAFRTTLTANLAANAVRNVWTNAVIFCGHFPDGAEKFTKADIDSETRGEWYLRQMLGSANISGGPVTHFLTGNLSHQIEHHLFPDLPSNRLAQVAVRVRQLCDKYDLPYTTGSLPVQYLKAWRTITKLALPDKYLRRTADDAPETASERRFGPSPAPTTDPATGRRRGLRTAITRLRP